MKTSPHLRTPEKEDKRIIGENTPVPAERSAVSDIRPVLPPTGPDTKRLSALPVSEKKPVLAPRPSLNPLIERAVSSQSQSNNTLAPIGFEAVEIELRRQGSVRQVPLAGPPRPDEDTLDSRKPPATAAKRFSTFEGGGGGGNPTHHPNAVSIFGGIQPPTPMDRTKFDTEKSRPSVPERPSIIKLQGRIYKIDFLFIVG